MTSVEQHPMHCKAVEVVDTRIVPAGLNGLLRMAIYTCQCGYTWQSMAIEQPNINYRGEPIERERWPVR